MDSNDMLVVYHPFKHVKRGKEAPLKVSSEIAGKFNEVYNLGDVTGVDASRATLTIKVISLWNTSNNIKV